MFKNSGKTSEKKTCGQWNDNRTISSKIQQKLKKTSEKVTKNAALPSP